MKQDDDMERALRWMRTEQAEEDGTEALRWQERFTIRSATSDASIVAIGCNEDPWFYLLDPLPPSLTFSRGDEIVAAAAREEEARVIVAITVVSTLLGSHYEILAPRRIAPARPRAPYLSQMLLDREGLCDLRPGTLVLGGRKSGFYDNDGIILAAEHIGGDPAKMEDWAYLVVPVDGLKSGASGRTWVTLNDIFAPIAPAESVVEVWPVDGSANDHLVIDALIQQGEAALLSFLSSSPETMKALSPAQFEHAAKSIFSELGFAVEPLGTYNQADGGVDFLAISTTPSDTEIKTVVQCKTSRNKVSARPIRELSGVLGKFQAHHGMVVTNSAFTDQARAEQQAYYWQIDIADRDQLFDKIRRVVARE